ncbi:uncharacterized protein EV422DRAFT_1875 [Fimicolochytrium jonesii]|uniref:uncharacterized protein n=1 Tax=Fimicolochytrium jonesii TaxID=1396493 RepID=UPI0022FE5963|nr:uncharacterized protein EV422DRAFT_1875 [Fimicolochytrium jonesii]KAI8826569.1 hypothetical protein EV422DRAFT_1875 [Fimicolochytrium jonesii]
MQPPSVSTESTPMSSPELSRANTRDAKSRKGSPLKFTTNTEELGANPVFAEESHGTNGPLEPAIINRPQALTAMTLPLLKSLVAAYDDSNDTKPLTDRLRSLYSDSDALNRSFLAADEERTHPSGIDMSALRQASSIIAELLPREVFYMAIVEALEITLARLQMNLRKLNSASTHHCRQLLIILECPLWHDGAQSQEPLLRRLCLVLGGLKHNMERTLSRWLSRYESDGLRRIVNLFLSYLDTNFQPSTKIDDGLLSCINVLKMLYTANETAKPEPLLPIAAFYSDAATKKLNFKEEYRIWKRTTTTSKKQEPSRQGHASQPQPPSPQNIHYTTRLPTPIPEFSYFHHPFLFDPVSKMRIMHIDAMAQMSLEFEDAFVHQSLVLNAQKFLQASPGLAMLEQSLKDRSSPYLLLDLRRERLVEDVLEQLDKHKTELKKPLKIRFIGGGEEGMDQGGVQKEFFQILIDQLVDPSYGMFTYDDETRLCWLNGASLESEREFELVGTVLGLALYNGVMLDVRFPRVMYKRLLDEGPTLEDLKEGWPSLGRGLEQLLTWTDGDVADVFVRTFEISYEVYGQVKTFPLVHGGEDVLVTNENRKQYVDLFVRHFVVDSTRRQFAAFRKGFWRVCGGEALKMCRPSELELMICGTASTTLDFTQLQAGAEYDDGYHPTHPLIVAFWSVVHTDLTLLQKKALLNFVTASDRVPLNGLRNLTFVIQRNGPDSDRLPTALTCFGRLLLPEYEGREKLRRMLVTAVENAKGFGLV